ncbi:MAG: radical SAM protein [Thermodesulfobacteriota bacterium]
MGIPIVCVYTVDDTIDLAKPLKTGASIPFGIAFIATVLKEAGHNVHVLVLSGDTPSYVVLARIMAEVDPRMFCLTAVSTQFGPICRIAEHVKAVDPSIYVVLGGHHASLNPDHALTFPAIDAICLGEGEKAVLELAAHIERAQEPSSIPNLWLKRSGTGVIERNALAPFNEDLDSLPTVDRDLWRHWIDEPDDEPSILVGRGCPNNCSYCSNHALRRLAAGRYVRYRGAQNVVQEVRRICEARPVTSIYLEVETLSANLNYTFGLCEALAEFNASRDNPVRFHANMSLTRHVCRDEPTRNKLFATFAEANLTVLNVGLESGSERIRDEVLRRPRYRNADFVRFCRAGRDFGIRFHAYVMIGLPGETVDDWKETVDVLRASHIEFSNIGIYYPYPGTDLGDATREEVGFEDRWDGRERREVVHDRPEFSRSQIRREFVLSYFRVFRGNWSFAKRCAWTARQFIAIHPRINRLYGRLSRRSTLGRALYRAFR